MLIQGEGTAEEIVFGAVVLAFFLAFAYVAGLVLVRFKNRGFRRAWAPLMPILSDAKIIDDGGGSATSWLSGAYRGAKVYASTSPNVRRHTGSSAIGNSFSAGLQDVPGKYDWSLERKAGFPGLGAGGWTVRSEDAPLQARLEASSLVSIVSPLGEASLRYKKRDRSLVWTSNIEPYVALPPEQFRITLNTLLEVASINNKVNS